jgi:MFS family permease
MQAPEKSPAGGVPSSSGYSYYVLAVLFVVYVFNFIDRQVLAILLEAIKKDLGASDTAMGFLSGFAFALFYTFAGIPIARWADRGTRRSIIALGLAVWSTMTAASGLARSFTQLALARVGVGIGEAAGSPPAHSLISDYFPPQRRATALSIYATGIYVGAMLAYLGGGLILKYFDWRTAFLVVGLPGIPLALLVRFTIREPPRGHSEGGRTDTQATSFGEVVRYLLAQRSFVYIVLAASLQSLGGYGVLAWGPTFLRRVHDMGSIEIGLWFGLIVGIGGSLGAFGGGWLADRLGRRDQRWYVFLSAIVCLATVPFAAAFLLLSDTVAALLCFIPSYVLGAMYVGPMLSMTQGLVKLRMRATASAILLFILNMIGLGAGPFIVGFLNDQLADRYATEAIRYSLLGVSLMAIPASALFVVASRTLREDLAKARLS